LAKRIEIKAPMSGIFYKRPSPDEPPYVEVGTIVKKKQVLGLLETMKVFQKIKSPVDGGKIIEITAKDGEPVNDNDTIFIIEVNSEGM